MQTVSVWVTILVLVGVAGYLIASLIRSIQSERRVRKVWANFGLSIAFCILFLTTWVAQGIAEWAHYAQDQRQHGEPAVLSDYIVEFGQSTLENWQSEFLQLFSFVVLSAILIHKGSAESKDSDEEMQAALKRIEKRLDDLDAVRT